MRRDLLARRRAMGTEQRTLAAEAIAMHALATPAVSRAKRVACYLSMPSEPGTGPLISRLLILGVEVIIPLSLPDRTLDWVTYDPAEAVVPTALGIPEHGGEPIGAAALESCDLIFTPAVAVDHAGHRLGRGAGYYDRALTGVRAPLCALVFTHELLPEVPHEPHDVPVQMVVTPDGLFRVP